MKSLTHNPGVSPSVNWLAAGGSGGDLVSEALSPETLLLLGRDSNLVLLVVFLERCYLSVGVRRVLLGGELLSPAKVRGADGQREGAQDHPCGEPSPTSHGQEPGTGGSAQTPGATSVARGAGSGHGFRQECHTQ